MSAAIDSPCPPGLSCAIFLHVELLRASERRACSFDRAFCSAWNLAVGETVILLHPPLPLAGVSIETMRECQQNDSLADG